MPPTPIRRGGLRVSKDTRAVRCWRIWSSMSLSWCSAICRSGGSREPPPCESNRRMGRAKRSEEHTSELQSLMRISYAVFCLKKKTNTHYTIHNYPTSVLHPLIPQYIYDCYTTQTIYILTTY